MLTPKPLTGGPDDIRPVETGPFTDMQAAYMAGQPGAASPIEEMVRRKGPVAEAAGSASAAAADAAASGGPASLSDITGAMGFGAKDSSALSEALEKLGGTMDSIAKPSIGKTLGEGIGLGVGIAAAEGAIGQWDKYERLQNTQGSISDYLPAGGSSSQGAGDFGSTSKQIISALMKMSGQQSRM